MKTDEPPWRMSQFLFPALLYVLVAGLNPFAERVLLEGSIALISNDFWTRPIALFLILLSTLPFFVKPMSIVSKIPTMLWLLIIWSGLSLAWSPNGSYGLGKIISLLLNILGLVGAMQLAAKETTARNLGFAFVFMTIISFLLCIIYPSIGVHQAGTYDYESLGGNWHGIFTHKNTLGLVAAIATILCLGLPFENRVLKFSALALCLVTLWNSQSKMSIGLVVACLIVLLVLHVRILKPRTLYFVLSFVMLMLSAYLVFEFSTELRSSWDPSLFTGRSAVWNFTGSVIENNRYFGLGYESIFNHDPGSLLNSFPPGSFIYSINQGHNGYLDVTASLGMMGFGFLWLFIFQIGAKFIPKNLALENTPICNTLVTILTFCLMHNFLETGFVRPNGATWIVLVVAAISLHSFRSDGP
jgi:exopolysaccharide production protein ExoQ